MGLVCPARFAIRLLSVATLFLLPSGAAADGGTLRLSERKGNYRITVFTSPTILRAGPVDISVLVQEAATGNPVTGARVTVKAVGPGPSPVVLRQPATTEAATNKLFYAATFDFPEPGGYSVEVSVAGALGQVRVGFEVEAAEPAPPWLALLPWVGWPALAVLLFCLHLYLARAKVPVKRPPGGKGSTASIAAAYRGSVQTSSGAGGADEAGQFRPG